MKNKRIINTKCQVFTPKNYVKELLDSVGYKGNVFDKLILENSCGDGSILIEIVKRYINNGINLNYSKEKIRIGLSNNIYGFEIDVEQYEKCIYNLNILAYQLGIGNVEWKIYNNDYLKSNLDVKFDFIVGNPPYITYSELTQEDRNFIRRNYKSCKYGKFDYCYAFIEHSIKDLSNTGKMSYLIPSGIFKTVFGSNLRELIKQYIYQIKDYSEEKIFSDALIKSAIIIIDKSLNEKYAYYLDMAKGHFISILKDNLKDKWVFSNDTIGKSRRFGDYFRVSHVVATLLNKAYVLKEDNYKELDDFYQVDDIKIEKEIVKDTATPRSLRYKKVEKIIFPYSYDNKMLIKINENNFEEKYPGGFKYLSKFRNELEKRKSDKGAKWYEYGRTQALLKINCEKILISTIITEEISIYKLDKNCIPYAGMYISVLEGNEKYNLDDVESILKSEDFMSYVKKIGISISGSSMRITSKDIEEYRF